MTCGYEQAQLGDPLPITALPERVATKISPADDGCWLWMAARFPEGYGAVRWSGRAAKAHRVVYELLIGPVPSGLVLDHRCRVRHCVNPDHLDPVTSLENFKRGEGSIGAGLRARTAGRCVHGHDITAPGALYVRSSGGTICRECALDRARCARYYYRNGERRLRRGREEEATRDGSAA